MGAGRSAPAAMLLRTHASRHRTGQASRVASQDFRAPAATPVATAPLIDSWRGLRPASQARPGHCRGCYTLLPDLNPIAVPLGSAGPLHWRAVFAPLPDRAAVALAPPAVSFPRRSPGPPENHRSEDLADTLATLRPAGLRVHTRHRASCALDR